MLKCELCGAEHDGGYGSGRFCSTPCARSYSSKDKRQEINKKVSAKLTGRPYNGCGFKKGYDPRRRRLTEEQYKEFSKRGHEEKQRAKLARWAELEWWELPGCERKRQVLLEQEGKCTCGLSKWLEKKLTLELHHIDGNRENNVRENLVILCPNCHSLTPNYRSKGEKIRVLRPDDETIRKVAMESKSIGKLLQKLGMTPRGANYASARVWLENLGILWKFEKK